MRSSTKYSKTSKKRQRNMSANAPNTADSYELEDLFDSIALAANIAPPPAVTPVPVRTLAPAPALTQVPPPAPVHAPAGPKVEAEDRADVGESVEANAANSKV